ncbi:MAG: type II toxin-antitoxin system Phd/YefM family antitoxin [Chloroflexi bacterium]|nr:MAG: type II toxin-antitoxin system Phd/YefM family antitoxin [Chloroflexota bacterium]
MTTKMIASTEAQNNFGRILDDVVQNDARYIIKRRHASQAILLSLSDFEALLAASENTRQEFGQLVREQTPHYDLGRELE